MSTDTEINIDQDIKLGLKPPDLWKVVFLNDDKTPMEFVITLLVELFGHSEDKAKEITVEIHNTGSGIAGIYTYEIAEQKGIDATKVSQANGHPLRIQIEKDQ